MSENHAEDRTPPASSPGPLLPDALRADYLAARTTKTFDEGYYQGSDEARRTGMHPFAHYLHRGERAGLMPSVGFDPAYYLKQNPDVEAAGISPLIHYIHHGKKEGRRPSASAGPDPDEEYARWIEAFDTWPEEKLDELRSALSSLPSLPFISVVMPVYNAPEEFLRLALDSVLAQVYPNWELCIADDASTAPHIRPVLEEYAARDRRISLIFREVNGHISAATNSALSLASGEYVAFLDHDDALASHALYYVARTIGSNPDVRLIYSDEDKVDVNGRRYSPHFKGGWNRDLLYSINYICHLLVLRRDTIDKVGGCRIGVEGSQDFDLILRSIATLEAAQIQHIPRVLYHWRAVEGSTAVGADEKSYATEAGIRALQHHFAQAGKNVVVDLLPTPTVYRVRWQLPDDLPNVSIIVPTRDRRDLVEKCVSSILGLTEYPNYTIWIAENRSTDPDTLSYLADLSSSEERVRIVPCDMDFNFSAINNFMARQVDGSILVLLNNDVEVISPQWLTEMVSHTQRLDVGAVGAKLYYFNDTIQHAGIVVGIGKVAGHSHKKRARADKGYFGRLICVQEVSGVTGACMAVRRSLFDEVGGLDEDNLKIAFNDVDFCLKLRAAGYRNLFTPHAELYHHESPSRGYEDTPEKRERFHREAAFMRDKWGEVFRSDPFYSPNLSYETERFALAWPPRFEDYEA